MTDLEQSSDQRGIRRGVSEMVTMLEPRRLFAYDLAVTGLSNIVPFAAPGGATQVIVHYINSGNGDFEAESHFRFFLSTDATLGNADDIYAGTRVGPRRVIYGFDEDETLSPSISAATPPGSYYLGVIFERTLGAAAEQNTTNNSFVTAAPVVIVTAATWPSKTIVGTAGNDRIAISSADLPFDRETFVSVNGDVRRVPDGSGQLFIDSGAGNDRIIVAHEGMFVPLLITGSGGADTIVCGDGDDSVSGGNGKDRIFAGYGDDDVLGGASNDFIQGGLGDDTLRGAGGNDKLLDDRGADYLLGGAGNDVFVTRDDPPSSVTGDDPDSISGGSGIDWAQFDDEDGRASIENVIP